MPGMGRSDLWWRVYHERLKKGASKESAARQASYVDKNHGKK